MSDFIPLDIEAGDADDLYLIDPDPSWVKLIGVDTDVYRTRHGLGFRGTRYCTVNGNFFDFPALDRHCGEPVESTIPFSRDLRIAAFQHDPPTTRETKAGSGFKKYSMDAMAERYLGDVRKSGLGEALAKEYGGWGRIPVDDPRYTEYLHADLEVTRRLDEAIPYDEYETREAWISTVTARTTLNGFRVNTGALRKRVGQLQERAESGKRMLSERHGFPRTNKQGKPSAAPQRTEAGKAAFRAALASAGFPVDVWPLGKDGTLSLSKEVMGFAHDHAVDRGLTDAQILIEAVQDMNGIRNNAANVLRHVTSDDRVHPQFLPFQSTGRWSVTPGMTVLKKGVEDSEREFFLPEEGHVLVSVDLDQIDIRTVAGHSQDPALIALLSDPGRDIHTEIAELSCTPRKEAKTIDLGWMYARSANAMSQMPGMSRESAERVCDYMSSAFPRVVEFQRRTRERGAAGEILDNGFGRRLRVQQDRAYTQSVAMIGQSATRDIIGEGLIDLARRAPEMLPMLRMIVHDEVVASVPEKDAEECARMIQDCLSRQWVPNGCSIPVSITAGQGKPFVFGRTWGELYR